MIPGEPGLDTVCPDVIRKILTFLDSRSLKKMREVSSSIRDKVEENSKIVHYWSFTSEFSTKHLKKFANEVQTVLGLVIGDATDNGLRYFVKKHQEINKFQLGSGETVLHSSKCSLKGLKALMALPNLTSVEIKRMIKSSPGQIIYSIQSTRLTTLELYNLPSIAEESILALLDSCSSSLGIINLPGNPNITDIVLLKIFQKFGHSLKSLQLGSTNVTGEILSEYTGSLPVITELKFGQCYQLTDTGLINLLQLSKQTLVYMDINGSRITGENLIEINGTLPCLENFYFFECRQLTDKGLLQIIRICGPTLKELDIADTFVTGESLGEYSGSLPNVEKLDCTDAFNLTDESLLDLLDFCGDKLKSLVLQGAFVTCESLIDLDTQLHIQNLECHESSVTDDGLLQLLRLCENTLKHLDLTETAITGEGLMENNITLRCLEELKLVACENLTDDGLVEFLQACRNTIKILDISCTQITGESMDEIEGILPCLTTLNLGDASELTETGLRRILEHTGPAFKTLEFDLEDNPSFSLSILQDIKQQYPNVKFPTYYD